ncbi:MAG: adenylate/guanylate cyclase domain-containing protein [Acidimicrobiia bacterium]
MIISESDLAHGLEAMRNHEWGEAYSTLLTLLDDPDAEPEHLEMLAEAAWWISKIDDALAAGEKAAAAYIAQGRNPDAARLAVQVAEIYGQRLQSSLASGWSRRAAGLLDGLDETSALGHLRRLESANASGSDEGLRLALGLAIEVQGIGARTGDRDLEVLGLHDRGRYMVYLGEAELGMAMMEEALVSAVARELGPKVTGRILCNTIEVTASTADYQRATEWSDQAMRWCESVGGGGGYPGACRVRRSEFMRLRGAWPAAEVEANRAASELADIRPYQSRAFNELGMIRLNTGDLDGAEDAFMKAHSLGLSPMPGLALLKLARHEISEAWSMIRAALTTTDAYLERAKLIPAAIEIALDAGEVDAAGNLAAELAEIADRYRSDLLGTFALQGEGRIAAHEGRFEDSIAPLRIVVEQLVAWGVPYEAARARCDLGMVLIEQGSEAVGWLEINAARAEFTRLGATVDLGRISKLVQRDEQPAALHSVNTMMFTDIVDSTKLVGLIGDESWADLISWHDRTIRNLLHQHHGTEIDHAGDGFFVSFNEPEAALECAAEIQTVLRRHRKDSGFSPRVRIGVHVGQVLQSSGALVGLEVHTAARVAGAAEGDQVLVSKVTVEVVGDSFVFGPGQEIKAKGIGEALVIHPLVWDP